jgi:hypothetical protein
MGMGLAAEARFEDDAGGGDDAAGGGIPSERRANGPATAAKRCSSAFKAAPTFPSSPPSEAAFPQVLPPRSTAAVCIASRIASA